MKEIRGVITAMVTPFDRNGRVDLDAGRRLAAYLVSHGSHGIVISGSTGESATITDPEAFELMAVVREEVGEETLLAFGTGTNDTRHSVELTKSAVENGADAALVVTPYYNKPNPAGILAHFEAVAEAAGDLPIIAYNIPSRVVVNMPPSLLAELAQIDNVVAVKQANNDELQPIEGLDILAGNDEIFLKTLEIGGAGGICVASHLVGPQMREVWDAAQAGDLERAHDIDSGLHEVYAAMGVTTNPIPLKAALEMTGLIPSGTLRLPLVPVNAEQRATVRAALESVGLTAVTP
ncbi:MAG TPA: 4-hydroxy-tetrahydrodipicolinate synthase [Solirubrobacterales bacterium]|nr:4-hydroxy-tetrahydrodipicolinate synthase [Solirubrobacterales bacterium]